MRGLEGARGGLTQGVPLLSTSALMPTYPLGMPKYQFFFTIEIRVKCGQNTF